MLSSLEPNNPCSSAPLFATFHILELRISSNMLSSAYSRGWAKIAELDFKPEMVRKTALSIWTLFQSFASFIGSVRNISELVHSSGVFELSRNSMVA